MSKLTLVDIADLDNPPTVTANINANNTRIEEALEKTLSRDGTSPNQMESDLDMNSHRIYNLASPASGTEPVRLQDVVDLTLTAGTGNVIGPVSSVTGNFAAFSGTTGKTLADSGFASDDFLPSTGISRNNASSYPDPVNAIVTTATHTNGSPTITVPNGSLINNGDTITGSFVFSGIAHVVSGGGTNTIVMSRDATSTSTSAVTFGHNRWDLTSTQVADTAGFRRLYVGETSAGRSTFMNQMNGAGLDFQEITGFSCVNEQGGFSGWFASRMSNDDGNPATGLPYIVSLGTYTLIDEAVGSRSGYNMYHQSNLKDGTEGTGIFLQAEHSLESYWPVVEVNPYNYNTAGTTRILRLDSGIGDYASRGEDDPENISAYIEMVYNGGRAEAGIIFGDGSLNVDAGRIPPAIAFAKTHALMWFSDDADVCWKIYSRSNTASDSYMIHEAEKLYFGETDLYINRASTSESKNLIFSTAEDARFLIGTTSTAESGSNAGSDFAIAAFDDDGVFLTIPFGIRRANGRLQMNVLQGSTSYADDAAAQAGGVGVGEVYRTGSAVKVRIS